LVIEIEVDNSLAILILLRAGGYPVRQLADQDLAVWLFRSHSCEGRAKGTPVEESGFLSRLNIF
tara:strand:- start:139 stop:330 length:192 start_codon:yes stop_codon:yes gene_type:complete